MQPPMAALRFSRVLQEGFVSVEVAGTLVVVRTMTGMAMAVAAALDSLNLEEIVGTIAGDDTIFLAVHSAESGRHLKEKDQELGIIKEVGMEDCHAGSSSGAKYCVNR